MECRRPCLLPTGVPARRWLRTRTRREKRPRHKSHQQRSTSGRRGTLSKGRRESCRQRWNFLPPRSNQGRRNRLLIQRFAPTYRRAGTPGGSRQGRLLYDRTSYRRQKNRWRCPILSRNRPRSPICRQSPIPSRYPTPTPSHSRSSNPSLNQLPNRRHRRSQPSQRSSSPPRDRPNRYSRPQVG